METIIRRLTQEPLRLLTLIGPAGVGKTRLALEAGSQLSGQFPDGVSWVNLAPIREPDLVLPTVGKTLGLLDSGMRPLLDRLEEILHDRDTLLILDNFEQVLPAGAVLADLLVAVPGLKLLVTSRVPIHLRWERTLRVNPLAVPDRDATLPLEMLLQMPSVALFVERAQAQRPDYTPSEQQVPLLVQLTRQLDGLPLAIELAAANMNALTLGMIAHYFTQHMQTLSWDAQDLPARQRSLHGAIGWSYQLLSGWERRLFRHLGVFVGRVFVDAVEAVIGEGDEDDVLSSMVSLAEKSLVLPLQSEDNGLDPSFHMLETVREYASEQLSSHNELDAASAAHAQYFLELAEQAAPQLRGRDQPAWYDRLEAEHDNLRAALRWLLDHEEYEKALRIAASLGHFWWRRGYHAEGWHWLEEALRKAPNADPAVRTKGLLHAGLLIAISTDLETSQVLLTEALALARERRDPRDTAECLRCLGLHAIYAHDWITGERFLQEALHSAQEQQETHLTGAILAVSAFLSLMRGDYPQAAALSSEAVILHQRTGDVFGANIVQFTHFLALHQMGETGPAVRLVEEVLRSSLLFRDRWQLSHGIEATLLCVDDAIDSDRRAQLLGAEDALAQATNPLIIVVKQAVADRLVAFRMDLESRGLGAAYRAGRALPFPEVVTLALGVLQDFSRTLPGSRSVANAPTEDSPLSAREQQVLHLVAEGLTSKQMGKRLFLSSRTVDTHLSSIFNKLGVDSRAQAVAVAAKDGLL